MRQIKKYRRIGKRLSFCLMAFILTFCFQSPALAVASQSQQVISPGNMKVWQNGAKVTKAYSGQGSNYRISVQASTAALGKGYYSVYLYDLTSRSVGSYDGFAFELQNKSGEELKINLTFAVNAGTDVSMTGASYAILESADHSIEETVSPQYGTISIPADYDGTVYVPLTKLYTADGKSVSLSKIQSWGITAVMAENEQVQYQMGNIRFLSGSIAAMRSDYYQISLSGNDTVVLPSLGSAMEIYQAQIKDMDGNAVTQSPTFYLKEKVPGVAFSGNGELQISSSCTASSVTIGVKLGNSLTSAQKTIALKKSTSVGSSVGIPKPSDVPQLTKPAYVSLNRLVGKLRIIAVGIAAVLFLIILKWFLAANRYYIKIRDKLLAPASDHEGEKRR